MGIDLGMVLHTSVAIALRSRSLWLYGLLLTLGGGGCFPFASGFSLNEEQGEAMENILQELDPSVLVAAVVVGGITLALLLLLFRVMGSWALGALLGGINQATTDGATSFQRSLPLGWRYFWPLLVLGLLAGLGTLALLLPFVGLGVAAAVTQQYALLLSMCLWLPAALAVLLGLHLLVTVAQVHVVLAEAGPFAALGYGWRFLGRHLGDLLLVWLVNDVAIGCGAGCVTSLLVTATALPALAAFLINPALGAVLLLPVLLVLLLTLLINGVLRVFQQTVWLLTYQTFHQGAVDPGTAPPVSSTEDV